MFFKGRRLFIFVTTLLALGAGSQYTITRQAINYPAVARAMSILPTMGTKDVTSLDTFQGQVIWKSYKRDGLYQLKRDLLYGKLFYPERDEYELFPPWAEPGAPVFTHYSEWDSKTGKNVEVMPKSIEEFNADPTKWGRVKGVIPKRTKIKMARVIFKQYFDSHRFYYIAIFVDGPFAGRPVLLNAILAAKEHYDSECLEEVGPDGQK